MRTIITVFFLSFLLLSSSVFSATPEKSNGLPKIIKLLNTKAEIKFYKDQKGDIPDFTLPAGSLTFPMSVLEEQDEYVKVMVNGKSAWVRSMNFKLERSCSDLAAQASADKSTVAVSGSRGAGGGIGCKK
jgi:hypothetical protein